MVRSDGSLWFTNPSYGYLQGFRPQPRLVTASGELPRADRPHRVVAFDVDAYRVLTTGGC